MKKLLALVLVIVFALGTLSGCAAVTEKLPEPVKNVLDKVTGTFENIKDSIVGIFDKDKANLDLAGEYLFDLYKENIGGETPANFDVVTQVIINGVVYSVEWAVDNEAITLLPKEGDDTVITVVLPEKPEAAIEYTLTATVSTKKGSSVEKEFRFTVPAYATLSYDEYMAVEAGKSVVVQGIVTHYNSKSAGNQYNAMYIQYADGTGGVYVYSMTEDPVTIGATLGVTVEVAGEKDIYNGLHEVKNASVKVVDATTKLPAPVDISSIYSSATSLKAEELTSKLGMYVTLKDVEITGQETSTSYYKFKLGTLESYLRISSSSTSASVSKDAITQIPKDHLAHAGYLADVTGVVNLYNGMFYIVPITDDPFNYKSMIERSDEEKVDYELGNLELPTEIKTSQELTLPTATTYANDVTITWASNNACAVVENGKLIVTLPKEAVTIQITATVKCGTVEKTKVFNIAVDKAPSVVPQVVETPEAGVAYKFYMFQGNLGLGYYMTGEVSENGYYLVMDNDMAKAVDVFVKEVKDGDTVIGYRLYAEKDGVKSWIKVIQRPGTPTSGNISFEDSEPTEYYTWDAAKKIFVYTADDGNAFFIGNYSSNKDLAANNMSHITEEKEGNLGVTNFAAQLVVLVDMAGVPAADKVAAEKENLLLSKNEFSKNEETFDLPTASTYPDDVTITWSVPADQKVVKIENGKLVITLDRVAANVVLTATIECDGASETKTFELSFAKKSFMEITDIETPEAGVAYKFYIAQNNIGKVLYFAGTTESETVTYRLATTTVPGQAADVYLEEVKDGETVVGYRLYFFAGEDKTKTYIEVYERQSTDDDGSIRLSGSLQLVTTVPENYYTWDADLAVLVYTKGDNSYYMGTYNSFETFSVSEFYRISGNNTSAVGVSQFPGFFASLKCLHDFYPACNDVCNECGAANPDVADHVYDNACDDTCNNCGDVRVPADHVIGDDGTCSVCNKTAKQLNDEKVATEKANLSVELNYTSSAQFFAALAGVKYTDVKITWASDNAAVVVNNTKGIITVTLAKSAVGEVKLTATITVGEGDTLSTDTKEFTLNLAAAPALDIMKVVNFEVGVAYQLYFYQAKEEKNYFFAGAKNSAGFFDTTTLAANGVSVYLQLVAGETDKYLMYYYAPNDPTDKRYIRCLDDGGKVGDAKSNKDGVFTYNRELGVLTDEVGEKVFYFGTYGSNTTIGSSNISYISGNNAANVGVSQYPCYLVKVTCTEHVYDFDCDEYCNVCGAQRETTVEHTRTNCDDNICDKCFAILEAKNHVDADINGKCDDCKGDLNELYIAAEKAAIEVKTAYTSSAQFIVPIKGSKYTNVAIEWASSDAAVTVDNTGLVTVKLADAAKKVTLTATLKSGEKTGTATFELDLAKAPVLDAMSIVRPAVGVGYNLYLYRTDKKAGYFFNGKASGTNYLQTTTNASEAVKVYLKAVADKEGAYYLCFVDNDTEKYIETIETASQKAKINIVTTPTNYYTWSETFNTLLYKNETSGYTYHIGNYSGNGHTTFQASSSDKYILGDNESLVGDTQYVVSFVTYTCSHDYQADCDASCGLCGETREATAEHVYENECATHCKNCGEAERVAPHVYTDCDDTTCNNEGCKVTREALAHKDTDGDTYCDNDQCNKQISETGDSPVVDVPVVTVPKEETTEPEGTPAE